MPEFPSFPQGRIIPTEIQRDLQFQRIIEVQVDICQTNREFETRNEEIIGSLKRLREQPGLHQTPNITPPPSGPITNTEFADEHRCLLVDAPPRDEQSEEYVSKLNELKRGFVEHSKELEDAQAQNLRREKHLQILENYEYSDSDEEIEGPAKSGDSVDSDFEYGQTPSTNTPTWFTKFLKSSICTMLDFAPRQKWVVIITAATATTLVLLPILVWSFKHLMVDKCSAETVRECLNSVYVNNDSSFLNPSNESELFSDFVESNFSTSFE